MTMFEIFIAAIVAVAFGRIVGSFLVGSPDRDPRNEYSRPQFEDGGCSGGCSGGYMDLYGKRNPRDADAMSRAEQAARVRVQNAVDLLSGTSMGEYYRTGVCNTHMPEFFQNGNEPRKPAEQGSMAGEVVNGEWYAQGRLPAGAPQLEAKNPNGPDDMLERAVDKAPVSRWTK